MDIKRRKTKKVMCRDVAIGGGSPVSIQSMTTTDTADVAATARQIKKLERAGCQIVRVAVLNQPAAQAIARIKRKIDIPLVADIHFDHRLALAALEHGADKIRINPGNIGKRSYVEAVINEAKRKKIPVRIGLNSGSVIRTPGKTVADDMVNAGLAYLKIFEHCKYDQVVVSLKAHDVLSTIEAYRRMAAVTDAPLHLGVTAAGLLQSGIIKSSIGIGALLMEGIGDTIRVSLTADPVEEVVVAKKILSSVGLRDRGIEVIACPTCGRCTIDLIALVKRAEKELAVIEKKFPQKKLSVAIMGCVVNGPGEAKDADIGIAWGGAAGILFKKGKKIKVIKKNDLLSALIAEVYHEMV